MPADEQRPAPLRILSRQEGEAFTETVLAIMGELEALLERESALIRKGRVREGLAEDQRKTELTGAYLRALERVKANAVALARFSPEAVEQLKSAHRRFGAVVETNQAVVATARAVSESLVKGLSEEMQRAARPQTYAPQGSSPQNAAVGRPMIVSRSL